MYPRWSLFVVVCLVCGGLGYCVRICDSKNLEAPEVVEADVEKALKEGKISIGFGPSLGMSLKSYRTCDQKIEQRILEFCREDLCESVKYVCLQNPDEPHRPSWKRDLTCEERLRKEKECTIKRVLHFRDEGFNEYVVEMESYFKWRRRDRVK